MADDNVESTTPIATEKPSEATKPEYVQDKFWNVDTKQVNIENLASSYNSLETKLGSRTEDLSKQIRGDMEKERLSKTPESYKLNVPDLPENVDLKIDKEMGIVKWWDQTAKDSGLSQEQYDAGVKAFVDNAVSNIPNHDLEVQKLGDRGKERVEAAAMWSKKHLTPDSYSTVSKIASTAEGVKAIEEIMKLNKDTNMPTQNTQVDMSANQDDLKAMINDPRYWDSGKRDPGYVRRVTELYEKAHKATQK